MNLIKSCLYALLGFAILAYGVISLPGADFDAGTFLNSATRSRSGFAALFFIFAIGGAFVFLGFFYFQMHRNRDVDPEIKKYIDSLDE